METLPFMSSVCPSWLSPANKLDLRCCGLEFSVIPGILDLSHRNAVFSTRAQITWSTTSATCSKMICNACYPAHDAYHTRYEEEILKYISGDMSSIDLSEPLEADTSTEDGGKTFPSHDDQDKKA